MDLAFSSMGFSKSRGDPREPPKAEMANRGTNSCMPPSFGLLLRAGLSAASTPNDKVTPDAGPSASYPMSAAGCSSPSSAAPGGCAAPSPEMPIRPPLIQEQMMRR